MKISSASKKVLASALSAAMVVAFAPTVAFGAVTDKPISITIDLAGGTGANTTYEGFTQGGTIALGSPTKDGYALDHWYLDANNDGQENTGEAVADRNAVELPAADTATYRAVYAVPNTTTVLSKDGNGKVNGFDITAGNAANAVAGHTYTLTVTNPNGTVLGTHEFKPASAVAKAVIEDKTLAVKDNPNTTDKFTANSALVVSGKYTITMADNGTVINTETIELVSVTVKDGIGTPAADDVVTYWQLADGSVQATAPALAAKQSYLDADGYVINDEVSGGDVQFTIKKDTVIKSTKVEQAAGVASYTENTTKGNKGTMEFAISAVTGAQKYVVNVVDPSGASIFSAEYATDGSYEFVFDATAGGPRTSAVEQAGDYVVNVTAVDANGKESASKAKVTLTEFDYSAGEGKFVSDTQVTKFFTDAAVSPVDIADNGDKVTKDGYNFKEWTLNGAKITAANKVKVGEVNTYTATYTARKLVALPTWTVVKTKVSGADVYTLTLVNQVAGATLSTTVDATTTPYTAPVQVNATKDYTVTVTKPATAAYAEYENTNAVVLKTMVPTADAWAGVVAGGGSTLETLVGKTSTKWLATDGVKAAIASGQAAIDAIGYYTSDKTAADKTVVAQYKALYEATLAQAEAELAKYADNTPVVVGDKAYEMTAAQLKTIADKNAASAKTVSDAEAVAAKNKTNVALTTYTGAITAIVNDTNDALKAASVSKLAKADIEAAEAVTAQLQAATTGEAADAALKAYAALTDAQKKLVATADVAKAEAVAAEAKAAAELVAAQDDAAVSKARNASKTVKAGKAGKTTKKQSVALKAITSASGAKVTYKKSSGKKAITVKGTKAYLAKGVKKGTYKATVKATCGTQTAKITVKFVVK